MNLAKNGFRAACASILLVALAGCSSGPVKRVSEPAAGIQQLTVRADGQWAVDLRIDNFSSVPMRFDGVSLELTLDGESAGTLAASPAISIGPESADIATVTLSPSSAAKIRIADALSGRRGVAYTLRGTMNAGPEDEKSRVYKVDRASSLTPVPGLPGVLR